MEVNTPWMCGSFFQQIIGNCPMADKYLISLGVKMKRYFLLLDSHCYYAHFIILLQLLTICPSNNCLALVYRDQDTMRFVKHINSLRYYFSLF